MVLSDEEIFDILLPNPPSPSSINKHYRQGLTTTVLSFTGRDAIKHLFSAELSLADPADARRPLTRDNHPHHQDTLHTPRLRYGTDPRLISLVALTSPAPTISKAIKFHIHPATVVATDMAIPMELARLLVRQAEEGAEEAPVTCSSENDFDGRIGLRISALFVILIGSTLGESTPSPCRTTH
jgi:hypothetical protein